MLFYDIGVGIVKSRYYSGFMFLPLVMNLLVLKDIQNSQKVCEYQGSIVFIKLNCIYVDKLKLQLNDYDYNDIYQN